MICKKCGNRKNFQSLVTYYEPVEIWEFDDSGMMERYNQPETGDLDIKLSCPKCNSEDIDAEGYDIKTFVERPLHRLDGDKWDEKIQACEKDAG
ncbi:hypothetical protein K8S19_05495 [bacterium]|nr:hypothetical protein [bacterium]